MKNPRWSVRGRLFLQFILVLLALAACTQQPPVGREAIIPDTTKVADPATRAALTAFDLDTGEMRFSTTTSLLASLQLDDVIVAEPSEAAPYGYLRKVKSLATQGSEVVLQTTQANLTDAIHQGWLDASDDLEAEDLVSATSFVEGVTVGLRTASDPSDDPHLDIGDGFKFEAKFNETLLDIAEGDVKVKVTVDGALYFNAGYNVGIGIEACFELPPVCVDRFEAWVGLHQYASLHVAGEANAKVTKEKKVGEYRFSPKCFAIGPVPVCILPTAYVFVGATGEVNLRFDYRATQTAQARIGAKWTDDDGWEDIEPTPTFDTTFDHQFDINAGLKAKVYTRSEGALLLYGIAGPTIGAKVSVELDAAVPRDPFWILTGSLNAYYGFIVDLPVIGRLAESSGDIYTISKEFGRSANSPPKIVVKTPVTRVDLGEDVFLGFFRNSGAYVGIYYVFDPEDDVPTFTLTSDLDGPLAPTTHAFSNAGLRTITVKATDNKGATATATFKVDVVNTPPVAFGSVGTDTVPMTVPYYISAAASDPNSTLACSNLAWSVAAGDSVVGKYGSPTDCYGEAVFNTLGYRTVTLTATDPHGAVSQPRVFTVYVTPAPPDPAPAFTANLSIWGCSYDDCFFVGEGGTVYNRYAKLSARAADADGDTITYYFTARCTDCANSSVRNIGSNLVGEIEYLPPEYGAWTFGVGASDGTTTIYQSRSIKIVDPGPN